MSTLTGFALEEAAMRVLLMSVLATASLIATSTATAQTVTSPVPPADTPGLVVYVTPPVVMVVPVNLAAQAAQNANAIFDRCGAMTVGDFREATDQVRDEIYRSCIARNSSNVLIPLVVNGCVQHPGDPRLAVCLSAGGPAWSLPTQRQPGQQPQQAPIPPSPAIPPINGQVVAEASRG